MSLVRGKANCILRRNDHLVTEMRPFGMQPFTDPALGLLVLVVVGCVDEVAALGVEIVKEFEDLFFGYGAHKPALLSRIS